MGEIKKLSIYEIIEFISSVSKKFLISENFKRILKKLSENTDYSEKMIEIGIKNSFLPFQNKKNLIKILRIEIGNEKFLDEWVRIDKRIYLKAISPPFINAIFSGNIPGIEIQTIFPALLSKTFIYAKPSYKMHFFLKEFKEFVKQNFKNFPNFIEIEVFKRDEKEKLKKFLQNASIVLIQGDIKNIEEIKKFARKDVKVIEYPTMFGAGFLKLKDYSKKILKKISFDIFLYNHRGCMSPFIIFLEKGIDFDEFCKIIDENIKKFKQKFDSKKINFDERTIRRQIVDTLIFEKDLFIKDYEFKFVKTKKILDIFFPGIIQIIYYDEKNDILKNLLKFKNFLQSFAISSYDEEIINLIADKTSCVRITKWGKIQLPSLFFPNKGNFGIKNFLKFCVLEK
jgi:hypothetical protein